MGQHHSKTSEVTRILKQKSVITLSVKQNSHKFIDDSLDIKSIWEKITWEKDSWKGCQQCWKLTEDKAYPFLGQKSPGVIKTGVIKMWSS